MPEMHSFSNKFSKIAKRWGLFALCPLRPQRSLIFDFVVLKLRDVAKFCFFKLIMTKSNFKKLVMKSFLWRHGHYITEKRHQKTPQNFSILGLPQSKFLATPVA